MTTIINASPSNGIVQTADGSGVMKLQSNGVTTNALAWVYFNGTTGAVTAAYNVGSVTRNSTGTYTLNFTNTLSDANYAWTVAYKQNSVGTFINSVAELARTTSTLQVAASVITGPAGGNGPYDLPTVSMTVFGN